MKRLIMVCSRQLLVAALLVSPVFVCAEGAPGAPGNSSLWTPADKQGLGTSYEAYVDRQYQDGGATGIVSRVWFSIAQGIVTETANGLIHNAQLRDLQLLVTGNGFIDEEKVATDSTVSYLHMDALGRPRSLAYRIVNEDRDGRYTIEKHVFTDPERQALFLRIRFTAHESGLTPFLLVNPHMENTGSGDVAYVNENTLAARQGFERYLAIRASVPFVRTSAGFVGNSDGWTDLMADGHMDEQYRWADDGGGNVALVAELPTIGDGSTTFDIVVGFGESHAAAVAAADGALSDGYQSVLDAYNGTGPAVGWEDWLDSLDALPRLRAMTNDTGHLLQVSAMVLKALEDKTHAGALIASLSVPWGDARSADTFETGYRAVWPRDFYQSAMALLALGDTETPRAAFGYLDQVQVDDATPGNRGATGWFLQKTHVDGMPEWIGLQMDQTAMPILLGWKLWQAGLLDNAELHREYVTMIKPAAEFLANGGTVDIASSTYDVQPPWTYLERWEEQSGYSPSTVAAVIAGLVAAADIADSLGDPGAADWYRQRADAFEADIERTMFTTTGPHGNGRYYLRINGNVDPNDGALLPGSNGQPPIDERAVLDPGFLELVRYGVRSATNSHVRDSLPEIDDVNLPDTLRVRYSLPCDGGPPVPGFRRYGNDGYGERTADGGAYLGDDPTQRGRIWPLLTGERGHYELAWTLATDNDTLTPDRQSDLKRTWVHAMECFANDAGMLPEQVWDGVGSNASYGFLTGEGTNSATALAWAHAEYIKLVRSLSDGALWDSNPLVRERYRR